jgi:penicillin-binding protein 1C
MTATRPVLDPQRPRRFRRALMLLCVALLALLLGAIAIRLQPRPPLADFAPQSLQVRDRHGALLRLTLASDERYRLWVPLQQIAPPLVDAVLLHEDAWFRWHPGVNPISILRAAWSTHVSGSARIGGSTLTMQLARLMYRLDTRSSRGKLQQIGHALALELRYGKRELLEAYLNLAPYGGNVEGVEAASLIYFDKPAAALSLPEALTLAVLPQAPGRRGRTVADGDDQVIGDDLTAARARLYARYRDAHGSDASSDALMTLPLALRSPRRLPFAAPHFVDRVLAERWRQPPAGNRLDTSIDLGLQQLLEQQMALHLRRERRRGVSNGAAILIDSRDMGVRALVGSADFFDPAIAGQVDGTAGKRSPGSTLKPFIYALALDQGVLHPASVLRDVPTAFGPFTPENFDGRFLGPVTATEALVRSRNIPAVTVAAQLSGPSFYEFLRNAGISRMASEQHYGLALVLGGGEVSMQELATLYAMLLNDGELRPLRWRGDDPHLRGPSLLSAEAAFITRDMLRQNPRPEGGARLASGGVPVAWKTGTSWAFRDAWTAGVVGPYVLITWLGNFDGSSNPALIGVEAAAPLFFQIVDALHAARVEMVEPVHRWPLNLARVEVCRPSGDLPNALCRDRGDTWFIPGKSPIRVSRLHRAVAIDRDSGVPVCGHHDPTRARIEVHEFWPSDLARVFAQAGIPRRRPPVGADCALADAWQGTPPRITSPLRATRYALRLSRPDQANIALSAATDADASRLYWFANDNLIATTAIGEAASWSPGRAGQYRLRAVDDHGRVDERMVEVAMLP